MFTKHPIWNGAGLTGLALFSTFFILSSTTAKGSPVSGASVPESYVCKADDDQLSVKIDPAKMYITVTTADGTVTEGYVMRRSVPAGKFTEYFYSRGSDAGYTSALRYVQEPEAGVIFLQCLGCKPYPCAKTR